MKRYLCMALALIMLLPMAGCVREAVPESTEAPASEASDYAELLFDASRVHSVDVSISEEDWADLKANPLNKTKYRVSVTIDGETVEDVSFATKGNTSLSFVASDPESDRYSFKINFGKYAKGQTYHGLNKLSLNNIYADYTYMKDRISYRIFEEAGVKTPLTSYVWLTVNGVDHGLYLAIEDISESWLDRNENGEGELYKPETDMLNNFAEGGNGGPDGQGGQFPGQGGPGGMTPPDGQFPIPSGAPGQGGMTPPDGQFPGQGGPGGMTPPDGQFPSPSGAPDQGDEPGQGRPGGPDGVPGRIDGGSNGADLVYRDDDISSYSDIFDNSETDADEADELRVIAALKALSEGNDLESCIDTDAVIRYFAAHNFVLNYDSYTGNMLHNYYLYEKDGRLSMLPWDYNLAFGAFGGGQDATELVNSGIDTPLQGAEASERPMWAWVAENAEYLEKYHAVYDELLKNYFESGEFEREIDALYEMLLPYVEKDPSAFCTAESFTAAVGTLKSFCSIRAESIRAQLDGTLAASTDMQDTSKRVDASGLDVKAMGSHGGGAPGEGDRPGNGGAPGEGGAPGDGNGPGEPPAARETAKP